MMLSSFLQLKAQSTNCQFKPPVIKINFGEGYIDDVIDPLPDYERISGTCPRDGYYTYTDYTSNCFRGDWHTLSEDHTPGDVSGNMMVINSSYTEGVFFRTKLNGLKSATTYEFGVWLMNVCKITRKCPFPLLPNIVITLQTNTGKTVAQFGTGEIVRREAPHWTQYRAVFTTGSETSLTVTMINNKPGGCGNDFALDDITLRECVKQTPVVRTAPKKTATANKQTATVKPLPKKTTPVNQRGTPQIPQMVTQKKDSQKNSISVIKNRLPAFPPPPLVLRNRANPLVKQFETEAGEIKIDLYDNGEIDGDTVSIYHNNTLLIANARLSPKPITVRIAVDAARPHHELIMVAENLGSIPPNTSLMIITAGTKRYQVFISSTEQKNAKVIFNLKE